jgi:hypothetical protein
MLYITPYKSGEPGYILDRRPAKDPHLGRRPRRRGR